MQTLFYDYFFFGFLEPRIVSYFIAIESCSQSSWVRGFTTVKIWKNNNNKKRIFSCVTPGHKYLKKILILLTYTKDLDCYVKYTLYTNLSTENSDFTKFNRQIGPVQDLQE